MEKTRTLFNPQGSVSVTTEEKKEESKIEQLMNEHAKLRSEFEAIRKEVSALKEKIDKIAEELDEIRTEVW